MVHYSLYAVQRDRSPALFVVFFPLSSDLVRENWDPKQSTLKNLQEIGLALDPNEAVGAGGRTGPVSWLKPWTMGAKMREFLAIYMYLDRTWCHWLNLELHYSENTGFFFFLPNPSESTHDS
jgi:hypothetical protein